MPIDISTQQNQAVVRELLFAGLVSVIVVLPAFVSMGMLAWVAIGSLLAFAVVHPRSLLFAVPAVLALSFRPVELGGIQLNMLEILIAGALVGYGPRVLAGAWALRGVSTEERHILMRRLIPDRLAAGTGLILFLGGIIAVLWMADGQYAAESLRTFRWTIVFPVFYFFLFAPVVNQREQFRGLAAALFLGGAALSATIAVIDGLLGGGVQADSVTRLSGIAPHPNALALLLDRALVLGLLAAILFRERISTVWLYPSLFVGAVTILTFSRGAAIGIVAGTLIILLAVRARKMAVAVAGAAISGIAGMIVIAPERTLSLLGGGSGSLRLELWKSSATMIRDHPGTGVGPDQFLYQYLPRYVSPEAWPERFTSHPHNLLLDSWLSVGIIGVVVLGMVGLLIVRNVRVSLLVGDRISLASAGALLTAGAHGLVDQSYFLPELAMSAWLLICLLLPGAELAPDEHRDYESSGSEG